MSTVEKEQEQKVESENSACCGVEGKELAAKSEQIKLEEVAKANKEGGCGCG